MPGQDTKLVITPTKLGTYPVICTELCGLGHALMRTTAIVMQPAAFDAWVKKQGKALNRPAGPGGQGRLRRTNGCASCHTLQAAGATGKVGPDLDKLPAYAKQAGKPLEDFVKESIVDPNAYVAAGLPEGRHAAVLDLPEDQLDALVQLPVDPARESK